MPGAARCRGSCRRQARRRARSRRATRSRADVESGLDCVGCGACWSACDLTGAKQGFLGPAALNRAMVLSADTRDGAHDERLRLISQKGGVTRCHYIHGCSNACPKGLDPAASIRRLRRWSIIAA